MTASGWEPGRIGLRISPFSSGNDMTDSDPASFYGGTEKGHIDDPF